MTIISFVSKFSWLSLLILVWLRALGFMAAKPGLTWGALTIFGITALVTTFFYIGMEAMLWDRKYPKAPKPEPTESESES